MWKVVLESDRLECAVQGPSLAPGHRIFQIRQAQVKVEGGGTKRRMVIWVTQSL